MSNIEYKLCKNDLTHKADFEGFLDLPSRGAGLSIYWGSSLLAVLFLNLPTDFPFGRFFATHDFKRLG